MDAREQRGRQLARSGAIKAVGRVWAVPSATGTAAYIVNLQDRTCTCPDHELRGATCKHIFAVEYSLKRETAPDGTVTETRAVRVTYSQDWPAYNQAQQEEKARVEELLRGLCDGIVQPAQTRGRPRLPLADVVFAATMKVYGTMSGRRSTSDIRACEEKGHIDHAPHYNSVFRAIEDQKLTPILKLLIEESALPLRAVESNFAVDSSGFSSSVYARWFDEKYGRMRSEAGWVKCHLMCGVNTHVVTAVEMTEQYVNDSPQLVPLLNSTVERFHVAEVSGDKAYLSNDNLAAVVNAGAVPYVPFKVNSTPTGGTDLWRRMFHFFSYERETFLKHYHQRSNVETVFSMIKRKFGGSVRSRLPVAQANEVYLKVLAHNLCCLVSAIFELGLTPTFWNPRHDA